MTDTFTVMVGMYSETCLKRQLIKRPIIPKCRSKVLQHSAVLSTFIKSLFVFKLLSGRLRQVTLYNKSVVTKIRSSSNCYLEHHKVYCCSSIMLVSSFKDVEQSPVKTTEEGLGPLVLLPTI